MSVDCFQQFFYIPLGSYTDQEPMSIIVDLFLALRWLYPSHQVARSLRSLLSRFLLSKYFRILDVTNQLGTNLNGNKLF